MAHTLTPALWGCYARRSSLEARREPPPQPRFITRIESAKVGWRLNPDRVSTSLPDARLFLGASRAARERVAC